MKHWEKLYNFVKNKKKAVGRLRTSENKGNCYCIEGAMCEIYRKETGQGEWIPIEKNQKRITYAFKLNGEKRAKAPQKVLDYFGTDSLHMSNDTNTFGLRKLVSLYKPKIKVGDTVTLKDYDNTWEVKITDVRKNGMIEGHYKYVGDKEYHAIGLFSDPKDIQLV